MKFYRKTLSISLPTAVATFIILLILAFFAILFLLSDAPLLSQNGALFIILGGLVPGLTVALVQFLMSWYEFDKIGRFQAMEIREILRDRNDEKYYRLLIENSKKQIDVLASTASRFFDDFADANSPRDEKKVLIAALQRGVQLRILIAAKSQLSSQEDMQKLQTTRSRIEALRREHPNRVMIREYNSKPVASLVRVDSEVVFGPILPHIDSKNTPSIHAKSTSPLSKCYLDYFESEWTKLSNTT